MVVFHLAGLGPDMYFVFGFRCSLDEYGLAFRKTDDVVADSQAAEGSDNYSLVGEDSRAPE